LEFQFTQKLMFLVIGSAVADFCFDQIGGTSAHSVTHLCETPCSLEDPAELLPQIYYTLNKLNIETGAFAQLTRKYMAETFNPNAPDIDDVR
jgi:triacylglycerol lipase